MRLKPEKIERLAELVYETLKANPEVTLNADREKILHEVIGVIRADLEEEEQLKAEAQRILESHTDEMRRMNVNTDQMLRKTMQQLAKERGFVL